MGCVAQCSRRSFGKWAIGVQLRFTWRQCWKLAVGHPLVGFEVALGGLCLRWLRADVGIVIAKKKTRSHSAPSGALLVDPQAHTEPLPENPGAATQSQPSEGLTVDGIHIASIATHGDNPKT